MTTPKPTTPGAGTIAWRALRLRCPRCGERGIVESWFRIARTCPACGFEPSRYDEGLAIGAYALNLVLGEFVALGSCVGIVLVTWPSPPWDLVVGIGIALAIIMPLVFYPFSQTLFIGLNLALKVFDTESAPRKP